MNVFKKPWLLALVLIASFSASTLLPLQAAEVGAYKTPVAATAQSAIDQPKLDNAKKLTDWLQDTLQKKQTLVAVVSRKGGDDVKKHDFTGMAHSGLAVYDPRAKTWLIYNLLNDANSNAMGNPQSAVWQTAPLDFFYGQTGYDENALLLIPDTETQKRLYEAFITGTYKKLLFTKSYNLLSAYNTPDSLNCNKWILMNIVAARIDNYNPTVVLNTITKGFEPGYLQFSALERIFVKKKPSVRANEIARFGSKPIQTVTVQSFYQSKLFAEKLYYAGSAY